MISVLSNPAIVYSTEIFESLSELVVVNSERQVLYANHATEAFLFLIHQSPIFTISLLTLISYVKKVMVSYMKIMAPLVW